MQLNKWTIKCNHTPETIDRIMMHFRKRGLTVNELNYKALENKLSDCEIVFEEDALNAGRIYKNLIRTVDVNEILIN